MKILILVLIVLFLVGCQTATEKADMAEDVEEKVVREISCRGRSRPALI